MNLKTYYTLSIILLAFCSCSIALKAQTRHELQLVGGGSYSQLKYTPSIGQADGSFGAVAGIGYSLLFEGRYGLLTGAEFGFYNASFDAGQVSSIVYGASDANGLVYDFYSEVHDYSEKQQAVYLSIPIMAQFQSGEKHRFFAAAGVKIGIPVSATYKTKGSYTNKGYFPLYDNWAIDQEFMGFGSFADKETTEKFDLGMNLILSIETGMRWRLTDRWSIHTTAFCDYGLNRINKAGDEQGFVAPNPKSRDRFRQNSVLSNTIHASYGGMPIMFGNCTTFAVGIKIKIGIDL